MGAALKPQKKSDVDPNFQRQMESQQKQAQTEGEQRINAEQVQWNWPEKEDEDFWDGDLFDKGYAKMGKPFNRDKANEDYEAATNDPKNPGKSGDLVVTTTQIDIMATMERAFRARHSSRFPRMMAHLTGTRKYGHGHEQGIFTQSMLDYVQNLVKQVGQ